MSECGLDTPIDKLRQALSADAGCGPVSASSAAVLRDLCV
jgi:hypothetical protein